jgi:lysophospholipase L1-like esterase
VKLQARVAFLALFSGDSTTAGDSLVNSYSQIHSLVQALARDKGFEITAVNGGHSGATAEQWRTTYLAADLATNPDLYVIRWGINDPAWNKNGTVGTANAYEAEIAARRDITDYATTMRAALTTIRAAKSVSQMSIILMVPNSTSDSPNGRDEKWYEQLRGVLRQCARDFQCAFVDTYAQWRDSRVSAGRWQDDPFGDGRAIHPLDIMNNWIASTVGDLLIPSALSVRNVSSAFANPLITTLPSAYPIGFSTFRAQWTINGVAVNGMVVTFRGADGICLQRVVDFATQRRVSERVGDSGTNTWQDWTSTPTNTNGLALSNSWTVATRGITYDKVGGLVRVQGRIQNGTATAGTIIATLPVGFRPVADQYFAVQCGAGLATSAAISVIASDGTIRVVNVTSNVLLDVGCVFSIF